MLIRHQIFLGEHEQNNWDLWMQRVPDLGDNLVPEDGRTVCLINNKKGIIHIYGQT